MYSYIRRQSSIGCNEKRLRRSVEGTGSQGKVACDVMTRERFIDIVHCRAGVKRTETIRWIFVLYRS